MQYPSYQQADIVFIVSLKYSPGLWQLMAALGGQFQQNGWDTRFMLSSAYSPQAEHLGEYAVFMTKSYSTQSMVLDIAQALRYRSEFRKHLTAQKPALVLIYNPHPLNWLLLKSMHELNPDGLRAQVIHEPHADDVLAYGRVKGFYVRLVEHFQQLSLHETQHVLLPSEYALSQYRQHYRQTGKQLHHVPLLFDDCSEEYGGAERKYISFVGTVNQARNLDEFINLVNFCAKTENRLKFKIVTRSHIGGYLSKLSEAGRRILVIQNQTFVSDDDIRKTIAESYAVFLSHRVATQSANIPLAYMLGTPVIARSIEGMAQHIRHGETGFLFSDDSSTEQLCVLAKNCIENSEELSCNARKEYECTFSADNWLSYFGWLP